MVIELPPVDTIRFIAAGGLVGWWIADWLQRLGK